MDNHYYRFIAREKRKGVSNRKISKMCGLSRNTVNKIVNGILENDLSFEMVEHMSDSQLDDLFAPNKKGREPDYFLPDFKELSKKLAQPHMTMVLLWEDYVLDCRSMKKKAYQLTQFKKYFNQYVEEHGFTDVIHKKAGEKIEVDWAGTRPSWIDPDTGEKVQGYLFVGVLSFSGYTFAKACSDMKIENWIQCHKEMYIFFDGVSKILVPDNLKTGVTKHTKEEVILNRTYADMAEHYNTVVIPARVRHPKDKPMAENSVGNVSSRILAKLANYSFFSIDEYNEQLQIKLEEFNRQPFQKKEGSRFSIYEEYEKEHLQPLPSYPYEFCTWKKAKVQNNSHISFQKCYYSVPYQYLGKEVQLKIYSQYFEVYYERQLICVHERILDRIGIYDTDPSHMPPNSQSYGEWNSTRYLNWAKKKGPYVYEVIYRLFKDTKIEQRYYRTAHSILKLADTYSDQRLDSACRYALEILSRPTFKNIKYILKSNEDRCQTETQEEETTGKYLRGGSYFGKKQ